MVGRMPVLRRHLHSEQIRRHQPGERRHDGIASPTASAPPGMKSGWTSTSNNAARPRGTLIFQARYFP